MMARTAAGSYLAHARQMMRHAAAVHATVARRLPTANETWQNKLDLYVPLPALRPGGAAPLGAGVLWRAVGVEQSDRPIGFTAKL